MCDNAIGSTGLQSLQGLCSGGAMQDRKREMTGQQLARILGYSGLIPFIVFSIATWTSLPFVHEPHWILSTYAAVILSFMGAVHWGVAMSRDSDVARLELGFSVVPALLGWLALLLPAPFTYAVLIVSFAALYFADGYISRKGLLPGWYLPMRRVLTSIVLFCLVGAALAMIVLT
jgi:hypothetical protein